MFDEYGNEIAVLYEKDMFGDIPVKDIYGNLLGTVREGGAMGEPALVDATGQIVGRISGDMTRDAFGAQTSGIISTDMFGDTNVSGSLGGLFDSGADFGEGNETGAPMRSVGVGSVSSSYSGSATNPYSGLEATTDSIIEAIAYGGMPNVEITRKQVSRSENPYLYESAIWYLDELAYWRNRIELLQAEASCAGRTPPNYSLYLAQYRAHEASYEKGLKEAKKRENDPAAMEIWLHEKCIGFIGQKEAAKAAKSQTELSEVCENFRKLGKYGYRAADELAEECIRYINELKYEDAMERIEIAKSKKVESVKDLKSLAHEWEGIASLLRIIDYRDAAKIAKECNGKSEELLSKAEERSLKAAEISRRRMRKESIGTGISLVLQLLATGVYLYMFFGTDLIRQYVIPTRIIFHSLTVDLWSIGGFAAIFLPLSIYGIICGIIEMVFVKGLGAGNTSGFFIFVVCLIHAIVLTYWSGGYVPDFFVMAVRSLIVLLPGFIFTVIVS